MSSTIEPNDPWFWTVDQVVSLVADGDAKIAQSLRFNRVDGRCLLKTSTANTLKADLGIIPLGTRERILTTVRALRGRSRMYLDYVQELAAGTTLPHQHLEDWEWEVRTLVLPEVATPSSIPRKRKLGAFYEPAQAGFSAEASEEYRRVHCEGRAQIPSFQWPNGEAHAPTVSRPPPEKGKQRPPLGLLARRDEGLPLVISNPFAALGGSVRIEPNQEGTEIEVLGSSGQDVLEELPDAGTEDEDVNMKDAQQGEINPRRVVPVVVGEPSPSASETTKPAVAPAQSSKAQSPLPAVPKKKKRQSFLPSKAHKIDKIYYDVEVGERTLESEDDDNWWIANFEGLPAERQYVNDQIRRLLMGNVFSDVALIHKGHIRKAFRYYDDKRYLTKHEVPSFTVYDVLPSGDVESRRETTKTLLLPWPNRDSLSRDSARQIVNFLENPEKPNPALGLPDNADDSWDYLLKWRSMDEDDKVLPLYGDSGSEGEYDLETWREIEAEQGPLTKPLGPRRRRHPPLSTAQVEQAINESIRDIVEKWTRKERPKLEANAYRIWRRAVRTQTRKASKAAAEKRVHDLEARIKKMKEEILKADMAWSSKDHVQKQCRGSMQVTIYEMEEHKWKANVMEMTKAPERQGISPSNLRKKPGEVPAADGEIEDDGESLGSESEEHSDEDDDGLSDFIVDDEEDDGAAADQAEAEAEAEQAATGEDSEVEDDTSVHRRSPRRGDAKSDGSEKQDSTMQEPPTPVSPPPPPTPPIKNEPLPTQPATPTKPKKQPTVIDLTMSSPPPEVPPPRRSIDRDRGRRRRSTAGVRTIDITDDDDASEKEGAEREAAQKKSRERRLEAQKLRHVRDKNRTGLLRILLSEKEETVRYGLQTRAQEIVDDPFHHILQMTHKSVISAIRELSQPKQPARDSYTDIVNRTLAELFLCWLLPIPAPRAATDSELERLKKADRFITFIRRILLILPSDEVPDGRESEAEESEEESQDQSQHRKRPRAPVKEDMGAKRTRQEVAQIHKNLLRRIASQKKTDRERREKGERVKEIVNLGHYAKFSDIHFHEQIEEHLKAHQVDGVRFMWQQLIPPARETGSIASSGALLAHTMGLGKTFQVIALLYTIAAAGASSDPAVRDQIPEGLRKSRTLILAPPTLVENWYDEFHMWVPTQPGTHGRSLDLKNLGQIYRADSTMSLPGRIQAIKDWYKSGGVLIMGYSMFRILYFNAVFKQSQPLSPERHSKVKEMLVTGPNIVVADEAHQLKNDASKISGAARSFRTTARIALTGSPLANNLIEYWNMIEWIHEGYVAGSKKEFREKYVLPIEDGLYLESSPAERRTSLKMLRVLKNDLQPKMHRADISVLKEDLPPKTEFRIKLPLTDLQKRMYTKFVDEARDNINKQPYFFDIVHLMGLICSHPWTFVETLDNRKKKEKNVVSQVKRLTLVGGQKGSDATEEKDSPQTAIEQEIDADAALLAEAGAEDAYVANAESDGEVVSGNYDWAREMLAACANPESLKHSYKMQAFKKIVNYCLEMKEKVLVFSHSIPTLDFLERFLKRSGIRYQRLDGKTRMSERQSATKQFNSENTMIQVFLVSTEAGGLGLNLYGANRVIIMDFKWTPVWEEQAVGRAYRMGQQKHVFVYRFQAAGTYETYMANTNLVKKHLSSRVVEHKSSRKLAQKDKEPYLAPLKEVPQEDLEEFKGKDIVLDRIIAGEPYVSGIEYTETFLPDQDDDELTTEDKIEADQMLEEQRRIRSNPEYKRQREMERRTDDAAYRAYVKSQEDAAAQRAYEQVHSRALKEQERLFTEANPNYRLHNPYPTQIEATKAMLHSLNKNAQNRPPGTAPATPSAVTSGQPSNLSQPPATAPPANNKFNLKNFNLTGVQSVYRPRKNIGEEKNDGEKAQGGDGKKPNNG